MKITQDEFLSLIEMMSNHPDGMKTLFKHLQGLVRSEESRVLNYDLNTQPEDGLIRLKLRTEGAAKLLRDMETSLKALKAKQKV